MQHSTLAVSLPPNMLTYGMAALVVCPHVMGIGCQRYVPPNPATDYKAVRLNAGEKACNPMVNRTKFAEINYTVHTICGSGTLLHVARFSTLYMYSSTVVIVR